jgi:DNA primase
MDFALRTARERVVSSGSSDAKELVRQAIDIVDLVGKYVQLRRQGRNFVGLCPWHDDTSPSLQVNAERQSFKCWVCDIGGDVFSFVMRMEGVEFPEALAILADRAGIPLKPGRATASAVAGSPNDKRTLYRVMAWAEAQYQRFLDQDPEAAPARDYLHARGITPASIDAFHLGFSPNRWDWILRQAQSGGPNVKLLEAAGLLATSPDGGKIYDRFRGRLLFSIRDVQERPIALGGRVLPESGNTSPAKYINSPETLLFRKSENLYGLDVARDAIRKSAGVVLVMEGYTDCIVAHQFGFHNAVAVLGTALGSQHIKILRRFAEQIVLVLDGDEAGQRRTNEVLELFVAENVDLRIVTLPEDLDPCDYLLKYGGEAFGEAMRERSVDALEHAFLSITRGIDLANDVHRASEALERMVGIVAKAPRLRSDSADNSRFREEKILQRLAGRFRMAEEEVRRRLTTMRRAMHRGAGAAPSRETPQAPAPGSIDSLQQGLLELLIRFPEHVPTAQAAIRPEQLAHELCRGIFVAMCELVASGTTPDFDRLMLSFDDPAVKNLLVELEESGSAKRYSDPKAILEEWLHNFESDRIEKHAPHDVGLLRERKMDDQQELEFLQQMYAKERSRQGVSEPKDG